MDPTGIFFLYVIASPQAECQARVNVNATHGTKTRVADVTLHLTLSSRSIYPAGITIGIMRRTCTYGGAAVRALNYKYCTYERSKIVDVGTLSFR